MRRYLLFADLLCIPKHFAAALAPGKRDVRPGTNTTLVMCTSPATAALLSSYLASLSVGTPAPKYTSKKKAAPSYKDRPRSQWGRPMMMRRLRGFLWARERSKDLKAFEKSGGRGRGRGNAGPSVYQYGRVPGVGRGAGSGTVGTTGRARLDDLEEGDNTGMHPALMKKDRERAAKAVSRRRVRGGAPGSSAGVVSSTASTNGGNSHAGSIVPSGTNQGSSSSGIGAMDIGDFDLDEMCDIFSPLFLVTDTSVIGGQ